MLERIKTLEKIIKNIKSVEHEFSDIALISSLRSKGLTIAHDDFSVRSSKELKAMFDPKEVHLYPDPHYIKVARDLTEELEILYHGGKNAILYDKIKDYDQAYFVASVCDDLRNMNRPYQLYLIGGILSDPDRDHEDVDLSIVTEVREEDLMYKLSVGSGLISKRLPSKYGATIRQDEFLVHSHRPEIKPVHVHVLSKMQKVHEPNLLIDKRALRKLRVLERWKKG